MVRRVLGHAHSDPLLVDQHHVAPGTVDLLLQQRGLLSHRLISLSNISCICYVYICTVYEYSTVDLYTK